MAQTFAQLVKGISATNAPANSLIIDSSGRVGLGTSSPGAKLHSIGGTTSGGVDTAAIFTGGVLNAIGSGARIVLSGTPGFETTRGTYIEGVFDTATNAHSLRFGTSASSADPAERMRIDSSGRVGIGTTSPDIYGVHASRASDSVYFKADSGAISTVYGSATALSTGLLGTFTNHPLSFYINSSEKARIDSSGRLLVGTSSAPFEAVINASRSAGDSTINQAAVYGEALYYSGGVVSTGVYGYNRTIYGTDQVGVRGVCLQANVAGPGYAVGVKGTTLSALSGTLGGQIAGWFETTGTVGSDATAVYLQTVAGPTAAYGFRYAHAGVLRAYLKADGGLANYSANNINLSDRNAKKDISPAVGTWDCLKEWEIVNFRYKDQPDDTDLNMGVIAQQVAESCPEVITVFQEAKEATETEPAQEERLGVKDQQMMWMAIKALQEAQLRIETLEAEVVALKSA